MFDDPKLLSKLESLEKRHEDLNHLLGQPEIIANRAEFLKLTKEHAGLSDLTTEIAARRRLVAELADAKAMLRDADAEMRDLAKEEVPRLEGELAACEARIKVLLLPKDPNDEKNILLEVRAGTGGDEAALFASDLFRMYMRYAERNRWRVEIMTHSPGGAGNIKKII